MSWEWSSLYIICTMKEAGQHGENGSAKTQMQCGRELLLTLLRYCMWKWENARRLPSRCVCWVVEHVRRSKVLRISRMHFGYGRQAYMLVNGSISYTPTSVNQSSYWYLINLADVLWSLYSLDHKLSRCSSVRKSLIRRRRNDRQSRFIHQLFHFPSHRNLVSHTKIKQSNN